MLYSGVTFISGANNDGLAKTIGDQFSGAQSIQSKDQFTPGEILVIIGGHQCKEKDLKKIYGEASAFVLVLEGKPQEAYIDGSLRVITVNNIYREGFNAITKELSMTFNKGLNMA